MKVVRDLGVYSAVFIVTALHFFSLTVCQEHLKSEDSKNDKQEETHYVYMNPGRNAHLKCANWRDLNDIKWYKISSSDDTPTNLECKSKKRDDDDDDDDDDSSEEHDTNNSKGKKKSKSKCSFVFETEENNDKSATLKLNDLDTEDYGQYQCRTNQSQILRNFQLRGDLRATRKNIEDKSLDRSVFVNDGGILHLYCNFTGLEPDKNITDIGFVSVTWLFKSEFEEEQIDITKNLTKEGLFANFEEIEPNQFKGQVTRQDHRGEYTCVIVLNDPNNTSVKHHKTFPIDYKFTVRVRDSYSWMVPGGILLVEILAVAIFTAVMWKKEAKDIIETAGDLPEDSDDDDGDNFKHTRL